MIIKYVERGEIDGILVASLAREIIKEAYYNCKWFSVLYIYYLFISILYY